MALRTTFKDISILLKASIGCNFAHKNNYLGFLNFVVYPEFTLKKWDEMQCFVLQFMPLF